MSKCCEEADLRLCSSLRGAAPDDGGGYCYEKGERSVGIFPI